MLFRRRQSRKDRVIAAAERMRPSRRAVARTVGVASGGLAVLTAASSGVSALRRRSP